MAQVTPRTTLPADSDTTGAVQITGASLRCSVRATALTTLALIRMDPSGTWFRITDETGSPMQFTAAPGGDAGNLDVSFTLPAVSSNEWYNLIADSTFAGYAEIDSLSAPPGPGGAVPTSRTLTPAGGVTLDGATAAVDLSADRTIGLGGTADMTLSTGALSWTGAAGKAGSLVAGSAAALTITANAASTWKVGTAGALTLDGFAGINLKLNTVTIMDVGVTSATKVTLAANKDLACAAGTTAIDASLGTGVTKTTTGLNTIGGDLLMAANKIVGFGAPQALSGAGAVNVTTFATLFTSTGAAQALTLADGTQAGQIKFIMHVVDGGSGVLTPTTKTNFTTLTLTAAYDWGAMIWDGSAWRPLAFGGTAAFA
jgi:hypothetical protein